MMANAIRALSMDAVQKAKSGHPGMPMGMADIATALWSRHLRFNPTNPKWTGRDRFILSNGHGSMLQYALLHLTGFDLSIDDLKAFRQLHSKTPGHPEVDVTPGVETTTGPLGQGIANGVGMALAEKMLASEFNREGFPVFDNRTYVFLGDGCMMEGISHEVCSLAGVWKLNKLIAIYDDNGISIDGDVKGWFGDDTRGRFEAYGWNVIGPVDGHDIDAVDAAIAEAKRSEEKPTLIIARTTIGKGSPARAPPRCTAKRSATKKSPPPAPPSAGPTRPLKFRRKSMTPGTIAPKVPASRPSGRRCSRATPPGIRNLPRNSSAVSRASSPRTGPKP